MKPKSKVVLLSEKSKQQEYVFSPYKMNSDCFDKSLIPAEVLASHMARVIEVSLGVQTILEMIERDRIEVETEEAPQQILSPCDAGNLHRLAVRSMEFLSDYAGDRIDWLNKYHKNPKVEGAAQ